MKAKYINEGVDSIFKGKSDEELKEVKRKEFERINKVTYEEGEAIAERLRELKVNATFRTEYNNIYYVSHSPIEIDTYNIVIDGNRHILEAPTKEDAEELRLAVLNNCFYTDVKIETDNAKNLSIKEAKKLIYKLTTKTKIFKVSDYNVNLDKRLSNPNYLEWRWNREKSKKVNESILKGKSPAEVEKAITNFMNQIEANFFTIGELKKMIGELPNNLPIGVSGHFGEFKPMDEGDFYMSESYPVPGNGGWRDKYHFKIPIFSISSPDLGPDPD